MDHWILIMSWLIIWPHNANGIIGYDCGPATANITTISLLTIEECDIPITKVNSTTTYIQLLQTNDFKSTKIMQCKIEIDRTVRKCGMFSHTMDVSNGKYTYIQEVTYDTCLHMHTYGTYLLGKTMISGLEINHTMSRPVTIVGQIDNDGSCAGTAYSDVYGSWTDVIVLGSIKITLQEYTAPVKLDTNQIILRSGTLCDLKKGHCVDIEGGNTFWASTPNDICKTNNYGVLYEGQATKTTDAENPQAQTVYSVESSGTIFSLASRDHIKTCGYTLAKTEHPKLFIFETYKGSSTFQRVRDSTNMDIFTYMNSKFIYIEKHIRHQINQLYRNILYQQCRLEQKTLQNALAIATQSPDIFAYHLMKEPGYTSILAGEVVHIVKCLPVEVRVRHTNSCYLQLPVLRDNQTYYLSPQTHLLLRQGTEISCSPVAPVMYLLDNFWYKMIPNPMIAIPPTILKPLTKAEWKYISPGSLATSGIYTQTELEELRDHIMFPAERPAVINTLARGVMGQQTTIHGGSFANLLNTESLEKIAASTWKKFWGRFVTFGNVSAGIIGIIIIFRGVKLILDTIIHGITLHSVFGCSYYLFGAIWNSLTQLLLIYGGKKTTKPKRNQKSKLSTIHDPETELLPITSEPPPDEITEHRHPHSALPEEETAPVTLCLKA